MEQEETRAIRTSQWLFMMRIQNTEYDFKHELYDLVNDPDERKDLAQDPEYADVVAKLSARLNEFWLSGSSRGIPYIWGYGIIGEKSRRLCYAEHYGSQITRHDFNSFGYS
jgi:arylsulfatase A-like enzyme